MPGALDRAERDRHAGFLQSRIEQFALVTRHQRVLVAVANEEWRIAWRDIGDGIDPGDFVLS
jgi:hypothetical protein